MSTLRLTLRQRKTIGTTADAREQPLRTIVLLLVLFVVVRGCWVLGAGCPGYGGIGVVITNIYSHRETERKRVLLVVAPHRTRKPLGF
jgi:hypothetical protein